jgi:hypothetical protein
MSEPFFPTDEDSDDLLESEEEFSDEITGREALAEPTIELGQEDQIELFVEPMEGYRTVEGTPQDQIAADQAKVLAESEAIAKATEAMVEVTGHFELDPAEGRIEFGDGMKGEIPEAGAPVETASPGTERRSDTVAGSEQVGAIPINIPYPRPDEATVGVEEVVAAELAGPEEAGAADQVTSAGGDDAQLAQIDLQNMVQKQQSLLQMMSTKSKQLFDTAMSVIRKMGR